MNREEYKIGSGTLTFFADASFSYAHDALTPEQDVATKQVFECYRRRFYTRQNVVDELRKIMEVTE